MSASTPPTPPRHAADPSTFRHAVRVYWEDTDAGGIVFYANHLKFFERARTEWLRGLGFSQQAMRTEWGLMFVVIDTAVRYHRPARLDDLLQVTVQLEAAARASLRIRQQVWRSTELLAEGHVRIGCVSGADARAADFKAQRIPYAILQKIQPDA